MPDGRTKTLSLIKGHRTNAEKEVREKGEKALKTSIKMKAWSKTKLNAVAKKHFAKIKKAFGAIDEDDILYEACLNRYCLMLAECDEAENIRSAAVAAIAELEAQHLEREGGIENYLHLMTTLSDIVAIQDKTLDKKRLMLLQIEKENLMTVNSKLRAVPKKPQEDETADPMEALLKRGTPGR